MDYQNTLLDLLKHSYDSQHKLSDDFAKGCAAWVVIIGFMIQYTYAQGIIECRQQIVSLLGISICIISIFVNFKAKKISDNIEIDIKRICNELSADNLYDSSHKLSYVAKVCTVIDIAVAIVFATKFVNFN